MDSPEREREKPYGEPYKRENNHVYGAPYKRTNNHVVNLVGSGFSSLERSRTDHGMSSTP